MSIPNRGPLCKSTSNSLYTTESVMYIQSTLDDGSINIVSDCPKNSLTPQNLPDGTPVQSCVFKSRLNLMADDVLKNNTSNQQVIIQPTYCNTSPPMDKLPYICTNNFMWDDKSKRCISPPPVLRLSCPYNSTTNLDKNKKIISCTAKNNKCDAGSTFNKTTTMCTSTLACEKGYTLDSSNSYCSKPSTSTTCNTGYFYNSDNNTCFKPYMCMPGFQNINGTCVKPLCDTGFAYNFSSKKCIMKAKDISCPPNYTLDDTMINCNYQGK